MKNKKTKFVIFGQGRSGSNLLVGLLNSHPDIYCDRELLNENSIKDKDRFRRLLIKSLPYFYIKHQVNKQPEKIYGFKLLTYQLLNYRKIRSKLFNQEWKIIHIQRKDVLAQTFSGIIALKTGKYMRTQHDDVDCSVFKIDPQDVVNKLCYRYMQMKYEIEVLKGLNYLDVIYENDLADSKKWDESAEGVLKYLGVQPVEVSAATLKTDHRTNEERISNYPEILVYLKNNGFAYLLE